MKKRLRRIYMYRRRYPINKDRQERNVRAAALRLAMDSRYKHVAVYLSTRYEFPTQKLIDVLLSRGKKVYYPVVLRFSKILKFARLSKVDADLFGSKKVISHPNKGCSLLNINRMDLIFTPLVAFDLEFYRLGRGAGHYDWSFSRYIKRRRRVGLAFTEQYCEQRLNIDETDERLDLVLYEKRSNLVLGCIRFI